MSETLVIQLATSAETVEVNLSAAGSPGAAGPGLPLGGTEFDLVEKASAADFHTRFTKTPKLSGLTLNPAAPLPAPLALGQVTWDAFYKSARMHIGNDGSEAVMFIDKLTGPVRNSEAVAINKGDVVCFAGAVAGADKYQASLMSASGTVSGLYVLGLADETFAAAADGLIKTEGIISGINTTGAAVSEVWATGQVLYVHPTLPGKLTVVRPAAPALVIPVAVVLQVHATTGSLGVRVNAKEDMNYGVFYSTVVQTLVAINTPKAVAFEATQVALNVSVGVIPSQIICAKAGTYDFAFSLQLDKSVGGVGYAYVWARKNGVDVPNSATRLAIASNNFPIVAAWNLPMSMAAGDYFELMWASDTVDTHLDYTAALAWMPAIPSAILTVTQLAS